jgi:flagellar basal-body rod modification protein FlgD
MSLSITPLGSAASTVANTLLPNDSKNKAQAATSTTPATGTTTSTASAASAAGDITSNDFLTLLVTEMQNQDPTQPTDPNAYIQQLVGVNSLQQLIAINQGIAAI